jgi:acyl-CoA hydrolase
MVRNHKLHYLTPQAAVACIASGHRVFIQGACAHPQVLVDAMAARSGELRGVEVVHLHTEGRPTYLLPEHRESFHLNAMFVAGNAREAVGAGYADYLPVFLSEVPQLFRRGVLPLDVALIHVSPPDRHGYCSLGISVDVVVSAVQTARYVVAQVNPHMPRSHGDGLIHVSRIYAATWVEDPLPEIAPPQLSDVERAIGRHVAALVEDGATLQMGIGAIPDAVLSFLTHHRRLGIHTEMFSDGLVDLVDTGAVTGECKKIHPFKIVAGFAMGTKKLYDFVDDNPDVAMLDIAYVNDTAVIRRNPRVTAINSCLEVDLCGQV